MINIFRNLINICCTLGEVNQSLMYESGFITIEGKTNDGKNFHLTLSIKEEEENA